MRYAILRVKMITAPSAVKYAIERISSPVITFIPFIMV
jgi:hypothetical protein